MCRSKGPPSVVLRYQSSYAGMGGGDESPDFASPNKGKGKGKGRKGGRGGGRR